MSLGYAICDLFFKGKGLLRNDIPGMANVIEHPSFFSISMGIGFGTRDFDFEMKKWGWSDDLHMKFRASTAVAAEGAYFFNPYIGVGGRLRVKSTPINGWDKVVDFGWEDMDAAFESLDTDEQEVLGKNIDNIDFVIESDHLTEFSGDLGVYFNLPLSDRFALGSKLLVTAASCRNWHSMQKLPDSTITRKTTLGTILLAMLSSIHGTTLRLLAATAISSAQVFRSHTLTSRISHGRCS